MAAAKPQLRGLLHSQIKRHLLFAVPITIGTAFLYKVLVLDARKKVYAEFYK